MPFIDPDELEGLKPDAITKHFLNPASAEEPRFEGSPMYQHRMPLREKNDGTYERVEEGRHPHPAHRENLRMAYFQALNRWNSGLPSSVTHIIEMTESGWVETQREGRIYQVPIQACWKFERVKANWGGIRQDLQNKELTWDAILRSETLSPTPAVYVYQKDDQGRIGHFEEKRNSHLN
eukprot:Skav229396  [mRNA]  locus=scaffold904:102098:102634:+ [translate_table: standard]